MICSRRTTSHANRHSGFTLIEVLAALVLVGIVLPVAWRGITLSMQASARAKHLSEATELAHLKLNELVLQNDTTALASSGDIDANGSTYHWTSRSVSRDFGMFEITVEIGWTSAGRDGSTSVTTLVYPSTSTSSSTTGGGG